MRETIGHWVSDDAALPKLDYGKLLGVQILSDVAATAEFDCAGQFLDTYQLIKLNGEWRISNKLYVDQ